MSPDTKSTITNIIAPIFVAVVVGLLSSFFMGHTLLAKIETRMDRAEQDISKNTKEIRINQAETQTKLDEIKRTRDIDRESFVRLETKIDILLDAQRRRPE